MSVGTESDKCKDLAKEKIGEAIDELLKANSSETWGSSDYNERYQDFLFKAIIRLKKIHRRL